MQIRSMHCTGVKNRARRKKIPRSCPIGHKREIDNRFASLDYFISRIASFAAFATLNFTTFFAGICIVSPVAGFLP